MSLELWDRRDDPGEKYTQREACKTIMHPCHNYNVMLVTCVMFMFKSDFFITFPLLCTDCRSM